MPGDCVPPDTAAQLLAKYYGIQATPQQFMEKQATDVEANITEKKAAPGKTPTPPTDMPRLKNLACTENRGVSGSNRTAKGSSNDSSISCRVKELSKLKGELFQSNSIRGLIVISTPPQCIYNVFTRGEFVCQMKN